MLSKVKDYFFTFLGFFGLVLALFVALSLTQQKQDIRPRALTGQADLLLSTESLNQERGREFRVLASLRLRDPQNRLRVSGADFVILYDKAKLRVKNLVPQITSVDPGAAFTDAPIVTYGGNFNETFDFLRVAEVARRPDSQLKGGTVSLAWITFEAIAPGDAVIKYPEDNRYLEIAGIGLP